VPTSLRDIQLISFKFFPAYGRHIHSGPKSENTALYDSVVARPILRLLLTTSLDVMCVSEFVWSPDVTMSKDHLLTNFLFFLINTPRSAAAQRTASK